MPGGFRRQEESISKSRVQGEEEADAPASSLPARGQMRPQHRETFLLPAQDVGGIMTSATHSLFQEIHQPQEVEP